jgi:hypothetical protein
MTPGGFTKELPSYIYVNFENDNLAESYLAGSGKKQL